MNYLIRTLFLFFFTLGIGSLYAQIRLPQLVSDGMVLQRNEPLKIWGWASAKERITVTFNGENFKTRADENGDWSVQISPQMAGGPYQLILKGKNEIKVSNILIGDVWLASGQSNMVHQMQHHDVTYSNDIATADNSKIRQFLIPTTPVLDSPVADFKETAWREANPGNVRYFSAVAYFFALKIFEEEQVPIGIINASVGGTPIEAWTSEQGLADFEDLMARITRNKDTAYVHSFRRTEPSAPPVVKDKGLLGEEKWYSSEYEPKGWRPINVPGYWEDQSLKELNGTVWYRKEVEVSERLAASPAKIFAGRIIDADEVYINGTKVGGRTYQYPQRIYEIPDGVLKPGKNLIVIKVTNYGGKGGFVPDKPYFIASAKDTVSLLGQWAYKVGEVFPPRRFSGYGFSAQNQPAALYNGMIAPATNYKIKGVLWYQGESNAGRPEQYAQLQPAQIYDWRNQFANSELPFIYVQLPNFMDYTFQPVESNWAQLRESQRKALSVPNTAMAVGIDLGEWNDIHPDNKKSVGERMALAALNLAYGKDIVSSGPMVKKAVKEKNEIRLTFEHVGGGLQSLDGEELREFALAGYDKKFVWADARIDGNEIVVSSEEIDNPKFVRYAWADNPYVNLYNMEGLPASPFEMIIDEPEQLWHGKKAAVVLTYDDALNVHLDNAIPELDARGLKGSFYLSAAFPGSQERIEDWRKAAANGHELGNHTLYHPCDASKPGRSWVSPERDLSKYTTERIVNEIKMTNIFLEALDGQTERTFAYTCGDTETVEGSFIPAIKDDFVAMRGVRGQLNEIGKINLQNVDCFGVNGERGTELIAWVKNAMEQNALITILFHGVGGEHDLNVSLEAHEELLDFLKEHEKDVWVTTMLEAARHVKEQQK
ncbi:sialate O-acetylesterase [Jiulongibacter sediminis]|jgi:sialate O-acetylesterase|uniref:sialate O-acetylesterase n=1 Tax=Jiulongibacter sediminis TaxID=1605367 RepID=UPI0026EC389F|nr:sialate O-acetylesterase [Jiulongibacter sediminis]